MAVRLSVVDCTVCTCTLAVAGLKGDSIQWERCLCDRAAMHLTHLHVRLTLMKMMVTQAKPMIICTELIGLV